MRIVFKGIGLLFLIWLSMHLWFLMFQPTLPGQGAGWGAFPTIDKTIPVRPMDSAPPAGPGESAAPDRPFDRYFLIMYSLPLFLAWLTCAVNRARQISPLAFVAAQLLLDLLVYVAIEGAGIAAPYAAEIDPTFGDALHDLSTISAAKLIMLLIAAALWLAWRIPGFMGFVLSGPRRLDRALRALLDDGDGWIARHHGEAAARQAHMVMLLLLTGLAAWLLWQACDDIDGRGTPDLIAYLVRSAAVAFGAFLLVRTHLEVYGQPETA